MAYCFHSCGGASTSLHLLLWRCPHLSPQWKVSTLFTFLQHSLPPPIAFLIVSFLAIVLTIKVNPLCLPCLGPDAVSLPTICHKCTLQTCQATPVMPASASLPSVIPGTSGMLCPDPKHVLPSINNLWILKVKLTRLPYVPKMRYLCIRWVQCQPLIGCIAPLVSLYLFMNAKRKILGCV